VRFGVFRRFSEASITNALALQFGTFPGPQRDSLMVFEHWLQPAEQNRHGATPRHCLTKPDVDGRDWVAFGWRGRGAGSGVREGTGRLRH